ncbi:hypothetical protein F4680DRAFT_85102 [Xylaria scruposa]|nr:hypothetical protein F4680DRAFT_85102 [Xylaria scruposa]
MASTLVPKYHRAPNFSINPPEAGGLLELGSIIADVKNADEPPINEHCRVLIPQGQLFCSHQNGFTATQAQLRSGGYGIVAKLMGLEGIGGELLRSYEKNAEDVYGVRRIDTIYFIPTPEYIRESMAKADVKDYVEGSGYEPVYMVTGLKTARGPSVTITKAKKADATVEVGVDLTSTGLPLKVGPKFGMGKETRYEMGFDESTDFIAGIRVRKLAYKKHWLFRIPGALIIKEYNNGATMVDDDLMRKGQEDDILDLGEEEDHVV